MRSNPASCCLDKSPCQLLGRGLILGQTPAVEKQTPPVSAAPRTEEQLPAPSSDATGHLAKEPAHHLLPWNPAWVNVLKDPFSETMELWGFFSCHQVGTADKCSVARPCSSRSFS